MILESSQEHFVCFVKAKPLLQSFNRDLETYLFIVHFKFLIFKKKCLLHVISRFHFVFESQIFIGVFEEHSILVLSHAQLLITIYSWSERINRLLLQILFRHKSPDKHKHIGNTSETASENSSRSIVLVLCYFPFPILSKFVYYCKSL